MIVSAWVVTVLRGKKPHDAGDCVLLSGHNSSVGIGSIKCHGRKVSGAGVIIRFSGVIEMGSDWYLRAHHVLGTVNDVAK